MIDWDIYQEGKDAFYLGVDEKDNPYVGHDHTWTQWSSWYEGWWQTQWMFNREDC